MEIQSEYVILTDNYHCERRANRKKNAKSGFGDGEAQARSDPTNVGTGPTNVGVFPRLGGYET